MLAMRTSDLVGAPRRLQRVDDGANVLCPVARHDEDGIGRLDDDEILDSHERDELARAAAREVAARVDGDAALGQRVAVVVLLGELPRALPTADVAPAEVAGDDGEAPGLLRDLLDDA